MLHLDIYHNDTATFVAKVRRDNEVLATFDEDKKMINLSVLMGKEGEEMQVNHYKKSEDGSEYVIDYTAKKVIGRVGQDKDGVWFIEY